MDTLKVILDQFVQTQVRIISILEKNVLINVDTQQNANVSMLDSDQSNDLNISTNVLDWCENNVSNESNSDQIYDIILRDIDCPNYSFISNDTLIKC